MTDRDLLHEWQAAMQSVARTIASTVLMKTQAGLFERTVQILPEPSKRLESAVGIEPRRGRTKRSRSAP